MTLADTLVAGVDVIDLADHLVHSCVEFLPVVSAGIMLDDQRGNLRLLASTSEESRVLELLELQNNEGPCLEAFASGSLVVAPHLADLTERWPSFVRFASEQGIEAAYALPLRLRERTIGALNLFCERAGEMSEAHLELAHMMATMATLGILNYRTVQRHELVAEQLQTALNSRIVIEQAKGVIAERAGVDVATAFEILRSTARSSQRSLSELAAEVAHGRLDARALVLPTEPTSPDRRS